MREHGQLHKKELADVVAQVLELNLPEAPGESGQNGKDEKKNPGAGQRRQQVDAAERATSETEATGKGERKKEGTDEQQVMIMSYVNNNFLCK